MTYEVYEVYQMPGYADRLKGKEFGPCLTSEHTREAAIEGAKAHYRELDEQQGVSGNNAVMVILVTSIDDQEIIETVTLSWYAGEGFDPQAEWGTWNKATAGVL